MREVSISPKTKATAQTKGVSSKKPEIVISPVPYDKPDCSCLRLVESYKNEASGGVKPKPLFCNRDRARMKHYKIMCTECKYQVGIVWATDEKMTDFCDLHYTCQHDGSKWHGCFALNLSSVDGKLGIECSCGNDTRDFRPNHTLPPKVALAYEKENSNGREFGLPNSKYYLVETKE